MSAILKQDPPELTETNRTVPPALERVVRHCLEKNPEERFQSARDVAFNLANLSEISGSSATLRRHEDPTAAVWNAAGGDGTFVDTGDRGPLAVAAQPVRSRSHLPSLDV